MAIYFQILWNRLYIIVIMTLVAAGVASFITLQMEPIYKARAKLLIVPFGLGDPDLATYRYSEQLATTFSLMLSSEVVLWEAEQQLGEGQVSDFSIGLITNSELLQITATDTDPVRAQQTANMMADILLARVRSQYGVNLGNIEGTLGILLTDLEDEIQALIIEQAELKNEVPVDNVRIATVERTLNSREETYNTLLASYNQTLIDQTAQNNLLSIFEEAIVPLEPSGPSLVLNTIASILVGGFGGLVLVFFLELIHPRAYVDSQIEALLGADVIGRIPKIRKCYRNNVFEGDGILNDSFEKSPAKRTIGDGVASESFRRLRTKIGETLLTEDNKNILMLSAKPDIGKSTVSLNLAFAIARNFKRVLLIDADMHGPSLHHMLDIPNKDGLTQVLVDATSFENAVQETDQSNLYVLTAGTRTSLSAELLGSPQMKTLLHKLNQEYDYVIFDGAPLLAVTDSSVMASYVGGVIFVVNSHAELHYLKQSHMELSKVNANLLGVVVNHVKRDTINQWTARYYKQLNYQ